jgi:hypothetical protein
MPDLRGLLLEVGRQERGQVNMRLFAGRRVGPMFVGASFGNFHPGRLFLAHGSGGGYTARGWFVVFGLAFGIYLIWLCQSLQR